MTLNSFIIVVSLIGILVLILLIWHTESRIRIILSPFLVFIINDVLQVWPPAIIISEDNLYVSTVIISSTMFFCFGYIVMYLICRGIQAKYVVFNRKPIYNMNNHYYKPTTILITASILCILGLYLFRGLPPIVHTLSQFFSDNSSSEISRFASDARKHFTKAHYFGGAYRGQGLLRKILAIGWPFLMGLAFLRLIEKRNVTRVVLLLALIAGCFVFVAGDGTRAPFLWTLISLVVLASWVIPIRIRHVILITLLCMVVAFALSVPKKLSSHLGSDRMIEYAVENLAARVFLLNGMQSALVIDATKEGLLPIGFGSVHCREFLNAFPGIERVPFENEVTDVIHPGSKDTTYATMTYVAKIYNDFGWIGVCSVYFVLGLLLFVASQLLYKIRASHLGLIILSFLSLNLGLITIRGPIYFCVSTFVFILMILLFLACHKCQLMLSSALGLQYYKKSYTDPFGRDMRRQGVQQ